MGRAEDVRVALTDPPSVGEVQLHRALSSGARVHLLEVLLDEPGLDAATLADRLDLHVNTVRSHLRILERADLVQAVTEDRERPGRPRLLYRARGPRPDRTGSDDTRYRFLASVLASYLGAQFGEDAAAAEDAGAAWGRFVVDRPTPFSTVAGPAAVSQLVALLEEFGFDPQLVAPDSETPSILLRRCPFIEVAREHPSVVCGIHLGLMRGALTELGDEVVVEGLLPWARPEGCLTHLHVTAA